MPDQSSPTDYQTTPVETAKTYHWYKTWWGFLIILILIIICSFIAAIGFAVNNQVKEIKKEQLSVLYGLPRVQLNAPEAATPVMGSSDDKAVRMTVFGDYNCRYTKSESPVIRDFLFKHSSQLQLVYRDLPIVTDDSLRLALAARCASEQKMFWPMHDYLFEHQGEEPVAMIMAGAKSLNLDLQQYYNCLKTQKYLPQIRKDWAEGQSLNLQGTPTIFINDYQLPPGEIPADVLEKIFSEITKNPK
jgi:protein-disulfide isomerase